MGYKEIFSSTYPIGKILNMLYCKIVILLDHLSVHILPTENCTVAICQLGTSNQGFLAGFPWDFHAGTRLQAHGRSAGGTAGDLIHVSSLKNTATSVEIMICL